MSVNTQHPQFLAEWAQQEAIMLTWPKHQHGWDKLQEIESVFIEIITAIAKDEKILIICSNKTHQQHISQLLNEQYIIDACHFRYAKSNDCWARDHGPISIIKDNKHMFLDFEFNAWGNKYPFSNDNKINQIIFNNQDMQKVNFVLEGGSIETDGLGTLLSTEACLLNNNRNPLFSRSEIENLLSQQLGIKHFLWLKHGFLLGDDTDSHIDNLARFCNPNSIMYATTDENNEHFESLNKMLAELKTFTNKQQQHYRLIALPLPKAIYDEKKQRLPASYLNFLITNKSILVPNFNDDYDQSAINTFKKEFPQHKIIAINSLPLIKQYGGIHCLCMQLTKLKPL